MRPFLVVLTFGHNIGANGPQFFLARQKSTFRKRFVALSLGPSAIIPKRNIKMDQKQKTTILADIAGN